MDYDVTFRILLHPNIYTLSPGLAYETPEGVGYADMWEAMFVFKVYHNKLTYFGLVEMGMGISERGEMEERMDLPERHLAATKQLLHF